MNISFGSISNLHTSSIIPIFVYRPNGISTSRASKKKKTFMHAGLSSALSVEHLIFQNQMGHSFIPFYIQIFHLMIPYQGQDMARIRPGYGQVMARIWPRYGLLLHLFNLPPRYFQSTSSHSFPIWWDHARLGRICLMIPRIQWLRP